MLLEVTLNIVGVESVAFMQVDIRMFKPQTLERLEHGEPGDCSRYHGSGNRTVESCIAGLDDSCALGLGRLGGHDTEMPAQLSVDDPGDAERNNCCDQYIGMFFPCTWVEHQILAHFIGERHQSRIEILPVTFTRLIGVDITFEFRSRRECGVVAPKYLLCVELIGCQTRKSLAFEIL
ncbi:hypothetical protein D3C85_1216680 [compost metagenome]